MLIAYRDYVAGGDLEETTADWEDAAPLSNAQDRRLAVPAIASSNATRSFMVHFSEAKRIGIVALLAHNFDSVNLLGLRITLKDDQGVGNTLYEYIRNFGDIWTPAVDSQFPRNLFHTFDEVSDVWKIEVELTNNGGGATPFRFGRFWAGPIWTPSGLTARRDFRMQTRDDSVVNKSIGQQVYVDYKPRYRQLTCAIPKLTEAEAFGTEDGLTQNLQDIAFECGRGGEVIVIPTQSSNQMIHKAGVYGHFLEPPTVDFHENASGRKYHTTFEVVEDL